MTLTLYQKLVLRGIWACLFCLLRIAAKIDAVPSLKVEETEITMREVWK